MRIRAAFPPSSFVITPRIVWVLVFLIAFQPEEILARVGGGQSYGGGNGGGGDGDGGAIIWIIFEVVRLLIYLTIEYPMIGIPLDIIVLGGVIYYFSRASRSTKEGYSSLSLPSTTSDVGPRGGGFAREFEHLRRFDPNFSEIVFIDFCYALYGKAQTARGGGANALDLFSPYLSGSARNVLLERNPPGLAEVNGVIVGAMQIVDVSGLESPVVRIGIMFETNYTEQLKSGTTEMTYYVRERWDLERRRDVLSPTPAEATALHCPRCGAALQRDTIGACAFCGTKIDSGEFQWYVRDVVLLSREPRGPLLTSDVPEVGTDYPSVVQPGFSSVRAEFEKSHPEFSWQQFQELVRLIFNELQAAWSSLNWERARPHETDSIFQMHQYWIDAYKRQGLRNVVDQCAITAIQPVKIKEDAFYNSITLRIWAQGYDYTQRADGTVVSGSKTKFRRWSEYWTFIRNRNAQPLPARVDLNCPNCGAPLKVNVTGICEFCGGKVTSGEFDWVLSRIEQDESYTG